MKKLNKIFCIVMAFVILFATCTYATSDPTLFQNRPRSWDVGAGKTFEFTVQTTGTFGFTFKNPNGEVMSPAIYDANGNKLSLITTPGGEAYAAQFNEAGKYYIKMEGDYKGSFTVDTKRIENVDATTEEVVDKLQTEVIQKDDADLFERVVAFFVLLMGRGLNGLISIVAGQDLTLDALIFDRYANTSLSFFSSNADTIIENPLLGLGAKQAINFLFDAFRNIAIIAYMIIIVYMGIRVMLLSTADKKAKYKQLLFDWAKGLAILFLFPYIMKYTILLNHAFVEYIYANLGEGITTGAGIPATEGGVGQAGNAPVGTTNINGAQDYMSATYNAAVTTHYVAYALCWFVMLTQVVQFLIIYLKRLIVLIFLITIFPLVAISYAIDKIGDGKSQAFDNWVKEFVLNVVVQSFHALNYVIIMGIVIRVANSNMILAIIGITYVSKGGDLIRGMFAQMSGGKGSESNKYLNAAKSYITTKAVLNTVKSAKKTISGVVGKNSTLGKGIASLETANDMKLRAKALRSTADTNEYLRTHNVYPKYTSSGYAKMAPEEIKKSVETIVRGGDKLTDRQFAEMVNRLSEVSDGALGKAVASAGLTPQEQQGLEQVITHATAINLLSSRRDKQIQTEIQQSVDVIIKDREEGAPLVDKYTKGVGYSNKRLTKIAASESIRVDEQKAEARRLAEAEPASVEEKVERAAKAIKTANTGNYDLSELHESYKIVEQVQKESTYEGEDTSALRQIVDRQMQGVAYSLSDFGANLAVQTINNKDKIGNVSDTERADILDESIRRVKSIAGTAGSEVILENLRADVATLEEGAEPTLKEQKDVTKNLVRKDIEEKIRQNPYAYDRGADYDRYLRNVAEEIETEADIKEKRGMVDTALGTAGAVFSTVIGTATAGASLGAASGGDKNSFEEFTVATLGGYEIANKPLSAMSGAVEKAEEKVQKRVAPIKEPGWEITEKSVNINEKFYENRTVENQTEKFSTEQEKQRAKTLEKIRKRLK